MSDLENNLSLQIRALNLPVPEREYRFCERRWRFDFAWPDFRLAVEAEGATFANGRHSRGTGYEKDCEKYNAAALQGWAVLRFTGKMIKDGSAIELLKRALNGGE
jgi:very-short-patch-repair endonuclease